MSMTVPALDYQQCRALAEAALGATDGESMFVFTADGTLQAVPPGVNPPAEGVLVPAVQAAKRTPLVYLKLQVQYTNADGTQALAELDATRFRADAVFWSDAAVKKFVQPYWASCTGYNASDNLGTLRKAWNGTSDTAQAFAMLHVTGAVQDALTPVEPLWVAFLDADGTTDALPLSAYIAKHDPRELAVSERPSVPYARPEPGMGVMQYPGYAALRGVAEWSASLTSAPMYFAFDPQGGTFRAPTATMPPVVGSQIVIPVHNNAVPLNPLTPVGVWMQPPGGAAPLDLAGWADAVFWSSGAIEQFMLPYYASVDGFNGLQDLNTIASAWLGNIPGEGGGIIGDDPGDTGETGVGPETTPVTALEGAEEVSGLVHMPKSAWVSVEEASLAMQEIAMVSTNSLSNRTRVLHAHQFTVQTAAAR